MRASPALQVSLQDQVRQEHESEADGQQGQQVRPSSGDEQACAGHASDHVMPIPQLP